MQDSHDDGDGAVHNDTDILPETVYHAVHHFTDVVRKEEWSALCDAALFVARLLIAGAARERVVAEQLLVRQRTAGESGAAALTSSLPPCPTLAQWIDTLDVLVHVTLPAALAALRSVHAHIVPDRPMTGRRASLALLRRCSHALVNLCFCVVVCYERTYLRVTQAAVGQASQNCAHSTQPPSLLSLDRAMRRCFDTHLALLVWNAESQLRRLAEGMTAELRGSPVLNDLPRTILYLTPYDDWIWLLLVAVLPRTVTRTPHDAVLRRSPASCSASTRARDMDRSESSSTCATSGPGVAGAEGVTMALRRLCAQGGDGALYAHKQLLVVLQTTFVFVERWCDSQCFVADFLRAWRGRRTRFVQDDTSAVCPNLNVQARVRYMAYITTTTALADIVRVVQLLRELVCGNADLFLRFSCRPLLVLFDLLDQLLPLYLLHHMCACTSTPTAQLDDDRERHSGVACTRAEGGEGPTGDDDNDDGVYLAHFTSALAGLVHVITDELLLGTDAASSAVLPPECGARVVRLAVLLAACSASRWDGECGGTTTPRAMRATGGGTEAGRRWPRVSLWVHFAHDVHRRCATSDVVSLRQEQQTRTSLTGTAVSACDAQFSQFVCLGLESLYALFTLFVHCARLGVTDGATGPASASAQLGRTHTVVGDSVQSVADDARPRPTPRDAGGVAGCGARQSVWGCCAAAMRLVREALGEALRTDYQPSTVGEEEDEGMDSRDGRSSLHSTRMMTMVEGDAVAADQPLGVVFATESFNALRLVLQYYTSAAELQVRAAVAEVPSARGASLHRVLWLLAVASLQLARQSATSTAAATATLGSIRGLHASSAEATAVANDDDSGDGVGVSGFVYALPSESVTFVRDRTYEGYEDWSRTRRVSRQRRSILERVDRRRGQAGEPAGGAVDSSYVEHLTCADALLHVSRRFFFAAVAEAAGRASGLNQAFVYIEAYSDFLRRLGRFSCGEWRGFVQDMRYILHRVEAVAASAAKGDGAPPRLATVSDVEAYEAHAFDTALSLFVL